MRNEAEIYSLILETAKKDARIRAVILNGSKVNPFVNADTWQDYDIAYFVKDLPSFINQPEWINVFGNRLLLQTPDAMQLFEQEEPFPQNRFGYLMIFEDYNRIDLQLIAIENLKEYFQPDSLSSVLLDKDSLFGDLPPANLQDYLIGIPNQQLFADCCNEFWWVGTYIAKGLLRNQIPYSKNILENPVRKMFDQMIAWYKGTLAQFAVSFGKGGKNMEQYLPAAWYQRILLTYPDAVPENIWKAFFEMCKQFGELAQLVTQVIPLQYNPADGENAMKYNFYRYAQWVQKQSGVSNNLIRPNHEQ
jgi:aminoglycoside 6-adenylyltransferase